MKGRSAHTAGNTRAATRILLRDGREVDVIPADEAGQFIAVVVCRDIIESLRAWELLTWRQSEAITTLARLRRAAGLRPAYERHGQGGGERPEAVEIAAAEELRALLAMVGEPAGGWLMAMLATDAWPTAARLSRMQDAADAIADRLRLPRENS